MLMFRSMSYGSLACLSPSTDVPRRLSAHRAIYELITIREPLTYPPGQPNVLAFERRRQSALAGLPTLTRPLDTHVRIHSA